MFKKLYKDRLNRKEYWWRVVLLSLFPTLIYMLFFLIVFLFIDVTPDYIKSITTLIFVLLYLIFIGFYFISIFKLSDARRKDSGMSHSWNFLLFLIFILSIVPVFGIILSIPLLIIWIIIFSKPSIPQEKTTENNLSESTPINKESTPKSEIEIWFEKKLSLGYDKETLLQEVKTQGYPEEFVQRLREKY